MKIKSEGRKVLITGGTGSVGRALVSAFVTQGDHVTIQYYKDSSTARKLVKQYHVRSLRIDFEKVFAFPDGKFDIVINNAGINISGVPTHEVSLEAWHLTIQINLTSPFLVIRQCLPWMIKNRWGRIINISSIYGLRAVEGNFPYTVSKHGMSGLTKTVAKEYAMYGITCNEICPGPIVSNMMRRIGAKAAAESGGTIESYLKEVCDEIPAKRMADPKEVAALAVFLVSPEAGYINGASIPIDGGLIA
jgi:3-hydroxybutyrate dehydrogenase